MIEIDFVSENTGLLHVVICSTQYSDQIVHEENVREENVSNQKNRVRKLSAAHSGVTVLADRCVKESPHCQSEPSELRWICVLIQSSEHRGHDQNEAANDEHEAKRVAHHRYEREEQFRYFSDHQEVYEEPQPTYTKHKYHEVVNKVFKVGYQVGLRRNSLDDFYG